MSPALNVVFLKRTFRSSVASSQQAAENEMWPMLTVNAYIQTMHSNYLRGIVLSGFSLAVVKCEQSCRGFCDVSINRALFISGLAGHHRWNSNAAFVCSGPSLDYSLLRILHPSLGNFPTTSQGRRQKIKINKHLRTIPYYVDTPF